MTKTLSFIVVLLFAQTSIANSITWVSEQLKIKEKISGSFIQKKSLSMLPRPIVSSGAYQLKNNGEQLLWHTETPVESFVVINKQGIYEQQDNKRVALLKASGEQFKTIEQLFSALLKGDLEQLENYFSLDLISEDKQLPWCLQLLPNDENFKKIIEKIELYGESSVNKIIIYELGSSRTLIELSSK